MRLRAALILLVTAVCALAATPAQARTATPPPPDVEVPVFPAVSGTVPRGFTVTPLRAGQIAKSSREIQSIHRAEHPLDYLVFVWAGLHYEVYFYYHGKMVADVLVGPRGQLGPTYTGGKMLGYYARSGFGQLFDSPWVLVPFTVMFLLPILFLRRRSWWDVLDLTSVLSFAVSYFVFDQGNLTPAVWLFYPPLLYLMVRMAIRGFRRDSGRRLEVRLPITLLAGGLLFLVAGRILINLLPSSVMDVGEASVIGAYRIVHGQALYFPSLGHPDTYGPINYLAYVPFQLIWPGDKWGYVPSARAAAITFDLLTMVGLFLIGRQLRGGREGRRLGLLMAWLWAACPATLLGMVKSTNDGLVALLVVVAILTLGKPLRRGVILGLGAAAKFSPAILLPLIAVGRGGEDKGAVRKVLAGFVVVCGVSVAVFLPAGGLKEMWDHTIGYQLSRSDIFSLWAQYPSLAPLKDAVELGAVALALLVAFRPRGSRTTAQVSALAAVLIIAVQLPVLHWFYFYIVWFLPLVLIAVVGAGGEPEVIPPVLAEMPSAAADPDPPRQPLPVPA